MVTIRTRIDGQSPARLAKYRNELKSFNEKLRLQINKQMPEIIQMGKNKARMIAPVDTGAMINAIRSYRQKDDIYVLQSRMPNNPRKLINYPYNVEMHENPNGKNYSGEPQFMYVAGDYMRGIAPRKYKNVILKLRSDIIKI